jgi:hypothetical protein
VLILAELVGTSDRSLYVKERDEIMSADTSFEDAESELDKIFDEFTTLLPPGICADDEKFSDAIGIDAVLDWIENELFGGGTGALRTFAMFFGISLLLALSELVCLEIGELAASSKAAVSVCMTVPVIHSAWYMISTAKEGLVSGSEFFSGAIPLLCSVAAIGGGVRSAATSGAAMSLSLSFV